MESMKYMDESNEHAPVETPSEGALVDSLDITDEELDELYKNDEEYYKGQH